MFLIAGVSPKTRQIDANPRRCESCGLHQAYLTRIDGEQYALYLPAGGSVQLDLAGVEGAFSLRWLDISHSRWLAPQAIQAGQKVQVTTPGKGHWAAVIKAPGSSKTRKPR